MFEKSRNEFLSIIINLLNAAPFSNTDFLIKIIRLSSEEPTFLLREYRTLYKKIGSLGRNGERGCRGGGVVVLGLVMTGMEEDLLSW